MNNNNKEYIKKLPENAWYSQWWDLIFLTTGTLPEWFLMDKLERKMKYHILDYETLSTIIRTLLNFDLLV